MTPDIREILKELYITAQWKTMKDKQPALFRDDDIAKCITAIDSAYAISVLENLDNFQLSDKQLGEIIMFIRHSMFLPENDKMAELNNKISQAIHNLFTSKLTEGK